MEDPKQKSVTLAELAALLEGVVDGSQEVVITGVSSIESATSTEITFLANPRYAGVAEHTRAGALLVGLDAGSFSVPTLRVRDPYLAFAQVVSFFHQAPEYLPGVHPTAVVAKSATLEKGVHIGAYVVVMDRVSLGEGVVILPHCVVYSDVQIGRNSLMHAHVVVRERCVLGEDVIVQSGAVIGGDGFGFAKKTEGGWFKIPQSGRVVIENGVEVQANTCIDRASVGETRIGAGTKIDNLVQVGHGSTVGKDTLLCAQVGLAGSTKLGDRVILAGQVGVAGHCSIGDDVIATAQSGLPGDVPAGQTVSGYPAVENRKWLKSVAAANRLPELLRNLKKERK